jgi:rod shape-determining protein MreC
VAGFSPASSRTSQNRSAAGLRFTIYACLALVLMYSDQRGQWSQRLRYGLLAAAYPVQMAVNSPVRAWRWLHESFADRNSLRAQVAQLQASERELRLANMHTQALEGENAQLRALHARLPPLVSRYLLAEIISVESSPIRQRVIVNRGVRDGVHLNQAAVDANGIVGQVSSVGPWSAEIILLTDPQHALPVQVARNQLRTIAVGSGDAEEILLKYLAVNADVKSGDILLSSGLGGVYPAGYPVGTVIGVTRVANQLLAQVRASPSAHVDRVRELMLLDFDAAHPDAPVPANGTGARPPGAAIVPVPAAATPAAPAAPAVTGSASTSSSAASARATLTAPIQRTTPAGGPQ